MCLIVNKERTEEAKRYRQPCYKTYYKVFRKLDDKLYTPLRNAEVKLGEELIAEGELKSEDKIESGAIHAFTSRYIAEKYRDAFTIKCNLVVVECIAHTGDFIAAGFTALYCLFGNEKFCTSEAVCFKKLKLVKIL